MDLDQIRREYLMGGLRRNQLPSDPFLLMEQWLAQAVASKIADPTAFVLATVSASGHPNQRIVLLKQLTTDGFVFYTNYNSIKANDMAAHPHVSLHFPWHGMERQVRVQGAAEKVSKAQSAQYFASRPRESQIAAIVSRQSHEIPSRRSLTEKFESYDQQHQDQDIPLPDFWGGYLVRPTYFEFWQGGANRLHDRFEYRLEEGAWVIARLAP